MALVPNEKQKQCTYVNEEQKQLLLEFMGKHPELQSGKFSPTFTFKHAQKLWEKLTNELHQIPGAVKGWKQWRKTWQDMRSATKVKNVSIKNYAKQNGGGPISCKVLTEMDPNILALIGPTVVEGHETVQESNVQFEWLDNSNVSNLDNDEDGEQFSDIICNEETQNYIGQNLSSQNCSTSKENYPLRENLNNNNYYNSKDISKESLINIKTTEAVETATTTTVNNTSHISLTPVSNSLPIKKGIKRTSAAQRYDKSIEQTEKLTIISHNDSEIQKSYYEKN